MADKKISQLSAAATPLAGTEVLPIVQSNATVKVSIDNLTAGKSVSAASFVPTGSTVPTNGIFLGAANSVSVATNSTEHWMVNASGNLNPVGTKGIGTNSAPVSEAVATTFSTSATAAGSNLSGNTLAADGTDTNIDINLTPKGTGVVNTSNVTASGSVALSGGTANGVLYLNGSKVATSGNALSFDATNLGVGVTPTNNTFGPTVAVGKSAVLTSESSDNRFWLGSNWYFSGGDKYIANGFSTLYSQQSGQHQWLTAPSGTAGNAISFTTAMTLDASGKSLQLGTTTDKTTSFTGTASGITVGAADAPTLALWDTSNANYVGFFGQFGANTYIYSASGALLFGTGDVRMRITTDGEVLIAGDTDQGAYNLQVNGTGVWAAGAYVNGSDERLKDNIQTLDSVLDVVKAMRPVTFKYKPQHSKDQNVQPGFIAQELQQAMAGKPYLEGVVQAGPEYLNVAYQTIIPILVKAIQELEAKVAALEAK